MSDEKRDAAGEEWTELRTISLATKAKTIRTISYSSTIRKHSMESLNAIADEVDAAVTQLRTLTAENERRQIRIIALVNEVNDSNTRLGESIVNVSTLTAEKERRDERWPDHCYKCERPCVYAGSDRDVGALRCAECLEIDTLTAENERRGLDLSTAERSIRESTELIVEQRTRAEQAEAERDSLLDIGQDRDVLLNHIAALESDTGPWRTWQSPDENGKPVKVVALTQAKARIAALEGERHQIWKDAHECGSDDTAMELDGSPANCEGNPYPTPTEVKS